MEQAAKAFEGAADRMRVVERHGQDRYDHRPVCLGPSVRKVTARPVKLNPDPDPFPRASEVPKRASSSPERQGFVPVDGKKPVQRFRRGDVCGGQHLGLDAADPQQFELGLRELPRCAGIGCAGVVAGIVLGENGLRVSVRAAFSGPAGRGVQRPWR